MDVTEASDLCTNAQSIGVAIRHSVLGASRVARLNMLSDGSVAKITRTTKDSRGESRQELTQEAAVVHDALAQLDAAGLWAAADYAPESMEFLDGEIIEIEARGTTGQYIHVSFINPDSAPDPRIRRVASVSKKLVTRS